MSVEFLAYFFAIATGIVVSGLTSSLWTLMTQEKPHPRLLVEGGLAAPVKGLVVAVTAPTALVAAGFDWADDGPIMASVLMLAGLALSFCQGVVILTTVFGVS